MEISRKYEIPSIPIEENDGRITVSDKDLHIYTEKILRLGMRIGSRKNIAMFMTGLVCGIVNTTLFIIINNL